MIHLVGLITARFAHIDVDFFEFVGYITELRILIGCYEVCLIVWIRVAFFCLCVCVRLRVFILSYITFAMSLCFLCCELSAFSVGSCFSPLWAHGVLSRRFIWSVLSVRIFHCWRFRHVYWPAQSSDVTTNWMVSRVPYGTSSFLIGYSVRIESIHFIYSWRHRTIWFEFSACSN